MESLTLVEAIARGLATRGVRRAFGMPGGVLLPLVHALDQVGIDFVLVRHEGSAGFMADATWQITGTPGVAIATLGPGITNLVSGVVGAGLERSRMLALSGQVSTELFNTYTHQMFDHVALMRPISQLSLQARPDTAGGDLDRMFQALDGGAPGVVHLDLPANVGGAPCVGVRLVADSSMPVAPGAPGAPIGVVSGPVEALIKQLRVAQRPVLAVGCTDLSDAASSTLTGFAEALRVPVLTSYRAKGMIPEDHGLSLGACGLSPVVDAVQQQLLATADLLICVGFDPVELRSNWLPGWPEALSVVSVDPHDLADRLPQAQQHIRGDIPVVLSQIQAGTDESASTWHEEQVAAHRARWQTAFEDGPKGPATTIRAVQRGCPADVLVSLDVGAHRITASHVWESRRPRRLLQSNGFSSMGTGLPAAIAARLAMPDTPVVAITGDMGLWMSLGELGVCQERSLDLVVVYLADRALSLIDLKQQRHGMPQRAVTFENPDVSHLAQAFGGTGVVTEDANGVERAVRDALGAGGLWLIEARIDARAYRQQM